MTEEMVRRVARWLEIRNRNILDLEGHATAADADHSSLLRRILEGGPVFDEPPPTSYSYPACELARGKRKVVGAGTKLRDLEPGDQLYTDNQCMWTVEERDGSTVTLSYEAGDVLYRIWPAPSEEIDHARRSIHERPCYLQRADKAR